MASARILLSGQGRLATEIARRLATRGQAVDSLGPTTGLAAEALAQGSVLVLANDDDAGNVDLALAARRLNPALPLVVRVFDPALAGYLRSTLSGVQVLSVSAAAAPAFAKATLEAIASRQAIRGGKPAGAKPQESQARPRRFRLDRVLLAALGGLTALVLPSTLYFAHALHLRLLDSLYFVCSTITTIGYGDISLKDASDFAKVAGMLLMFGGVTFMAVLLALMTDWVVARRLDLFLGRVQVRGRGHVILVGGGHVTVRVSELLRAAGRKVVVIERNGSLRNLEGLRAAGDHVIVADATSEEVLELAGLQRAGAVVALASSDAVNLQIALLVRARRGDVPVVLRVTSSELSSHVSDRRDSIAISLLEIAAEEFAQAAVATRPAA